MSMLLDLIIASNIRALKKPHISEYYRFRLNLSSAANLLCNAKASALVTLSAE